MCYMENATKVLAPPGTTDHSKAKNTHNQPKWLSTGATHCHSTGHTATPQGTNENAAHESSRIPSPCTATLHAHQVRLTGTALVPHRPSRVIARVASANASQCASHAGRAAKLNRHQPPSGSSKAARDHLA